MSESTRVAIEGMMGNLITFMLLIVGCYVVTSLIVHKTSVFSGFSRNSRNAIVSLVSVMIFVFLGYYFSGLVHISG